MARKQVEELEDVNLIPIMSILVILIPMIIFAFTFFEVTVQSVAAPKMGKPQAQKAEETKRPLNLTVIVKDDGLLFKYDEQVFTEGEGETLLKKREFPPDKEHPDTYWDYDYPGLHNRLAQIKKHFPDEETINIGADLHIPWRILARVIDSARLKLEGAPFEGEMAMAEYVEAKPVKVKEEVDFLFPNVVFVVAD
mgnify:CR=1 FL=1